MKALTLASILLRIHSVGFVLELPGNVVKRTACFFVSRILRKLAAVSCPRTEPRCFTHMAETHIS